MYKFFISDLHLSPDHPELFALFSSFLEQIRPTAEALYILGDFYEYWIGNEVQSEFQQTLKSKLAEYSKHFPIYFMPGNRDFLLTTPFYQDTGCIPLPDPSILSVGNETILLLHGDSLCTDRWSYWIYRTLSHLPIIKALFLKAPIALREKCAAILRGQDQMHHDDLAKDVPHSQLATLVLKRKPTIVIHGHTHYPLIELQLTPPSYTRYVLAAWGELGNTLKLNEKNEFELCYFDNSGLYSN